MRRVLRAFFRGQAGGIRSFGRGVLKHAIRLTGNDFQERDITELLACQLGRPSVAAEAAFECRHAVTGSSTLADGVSNKINSALAGSKKPSSSRLKRNNQEPQPGPRTVRGREPPGAGVTCRIESSSDHLEVCASEGSGTN
jgi:hypothetical protein